MHYGVHYGSIQERARTQLTTGIRGTTRFSNHVRLAKLTANLEGMIIRDQPAELTDLPGKLMHAEKVLQLPKLMYYLLWSTLTICRHKSACQDPPESVPLALSHPLSFAVDCTVFHRRI